MVWLGLAQHSYPSEGKLKSQVHHDLTPLELAVIEKMLHGHHVALDALRYQLTFLTVSERRFTGVGFFTEFSLRQEAKPAQLTKQVVYFGDVEAEITGLDYGAGFLLHIVNGFLKTLEGYSYGEQWPDKIDKFLVKYMSDDRSDELSKLH